MSSTSPTESSGGQDGKTPIYAAAEGGFVPVLEALIRQGSNAIDTPDEEGRTPMHIAASNGYVSVVEALVRLGSKAIDAADCEGRTPLHLAAQKGHVSVIESLICLGSKATEITDIKGKTPKDRAIESQQIAAVEILARFSPAAAPVEPFEPASALEFHPNSSFLSLSSSTSSSSSSSTLISSAQADLPEPEFDVFLCHRASDPSLNENVKEELAIPLYHHLMRDSFRVFLDKFHLSAQIPSQGILRALGTCNSGVVFFSQGFVDGILSGKSPWCLLELRILYAKNQWAHYQSLQSRGGFAAATQPKIFGVAVPPFRIGDCLEGEHANTPLPPVTHVDLGIDAAELNTLQRALASVSPKVVELVNDPTLTLHKLQACFPFVDLIDLGEQSKNDLFVGISRRLRDLNDRLGSLRAQPSSALEPGLLSDEQPADSNVTPNCFASPFGDGHAGTGCRLL